MPNDFYMMAAFFVVFPFPVPRAAATDSWRYRRRRNHFITKGATMKILVAEKLAKEGLLILEKEPQIQLDVKTGLSREELLNIIDQYEGLVIRSATKADRELLEKGKSLKIVARAGVGLDNVDLKAASERGIIVCNAPFGNVNSVIEHTMALILAACRKLIKADTSLKNGAWDRSSIKASELQGKVAGVIGISKIGGGVATRLKAFGCDVIGADPYVSEKRAQDLGIRLVSLEELIKTSDIITAHVPLTAETRSLLGAEQFAMMKEGVLVFNTARGGVINELALLDALENGKVAGAGIDVWSEEPPKSEELKKLIAHERVISIPHLAASSLEAQINVAVDVARDIVRYQHEQPLEYAANIPRFDSAVMDRMRPFLNLVNVMAEFIAQLADSNLNKITFTYQGEVADLDCTPLTVCGLASLLNNKVEQDVNMVNAALIAEDMGVAVEEVKDREPAIFSNAVSISIEGPQVRRFIAGTHFEGQPRIVQMRDYRVDFAPEEHMMVITYEDRPGMIGKIGQVMGEHEINIAAMNLGRQEKQGEAMVILSLDSPVPGHVVEEVGKVVEASFIKYLHLAKAVTVQ
jgi:D-3-phosphoglycerate dehydrogenase